MDEAALSALGTLIERFDQGRPGERLNGVSGLSDWLSCSAVQAIATSTIGDKARPVRAILFDKNPSANWSLAWHQDRTIAIRERIEAPGFGPWSRKDNLLHVEPPFSILAGMVTLRLHLDPVGPDNAPLLVAPGSHHLGRLTQEDIPTAVARCGQAACLAEAGDIWLYATPILHASEASHTAARRRVLQVDYAAIDLPSGLEWRGLDIQ